MFDSYLAGVLDSVNRGEPAPRVALTVRGTLVVGVLMPRAEYLAAFVAAGGTEAVAYSDALAQKVAAERDARPGRATDTVPSLVGLRDVTVGSERFPMLLPEARA